MGLPLNMDGTEGASAQRSRAFARNLPKILDLPVAFWDERLSTAAMERELIAIDTKRKRRAEKIDESAAAFILQRRNRSFAGAVVMKAKTLRHLIIGLLMVTGIFHLAVALVGCRRRRPGAAAYGIRLYLYRPQFLRSPRRQGRIEKPFAQRHHRHDDRLHRRTGARRRQLRANRRTACPADHVSGRYRHYRRRRMVAVENNEEDLKRHCRLRARGPIARATSEREAMSVQR